MDEPSMALPSLCGAGLRNHPNHQPAGHDIFMVEQNANGARDRRPRLCPANRANLHGHWNVDVVFRVARDSSLEGDGFELSVSRVMGGRFRTTVPAAIAVFDVAGTAVALPRHQGGWPGPSSRIPR